MKIQRVLFGMLALLLWTGMSFGQVSDPARLRFTTPQTYQLVSGPAAQVSLAFDSASVIAQSIRVYLNDRDVTARFSAAGAGVLSASLSPSDGLDSQFGAGAQRQAGGRNRLYAVAQGLNGARRVSAALIFRYESSGTVTATIGPGGGTIELPGVGVAGFPAGAFPNTRTVSLFTSNEPFVDQTFRTTAMFDVFDRVSFEVRLIAGPSQPLSSVNLTLLVPQSYRTLLPPTAELGVMYRNVHSDATEFEDIFDFLDGRFAASATSISVALPPHAFSSTLRSDGLFEATLIVTATPGPPAPSIIGIPGGIPSGTPLEAVLPWPSDALAGDYFSLAGQQSTLCDAVQLDNPLNALPQSACTGNGVQYVNGLCVTSNYGPRPGVGVSDFHSGLDLRAAEGTDVLAMADGIVDASTAQTQGGNLYGWGNFIKLRHTDAAGNVLGFTVYAHLREIPSFLPGARVTAGQLIGFSGTTGGPNGTVAPHLHVEYAPGPIWNRRNRIDPLPCIGTTAAGSITVRDNGSLADDAFAVSVNGVQVCETTIGAANTCPIGRLRSGQTTLTIRCLIAPDNVGTYQIGLENGLTFLGGGTSRSGTIPQGGSASFIIVVP